MNPTDQQLDAVGLFLTGRSLAVQAGAGTGKTTTLRLLAEAAREFGSTCQYVAFNASIVTEAGRTMPRNTRCNTAHSLAYGQVGRRFGHRLDSPRLKSWQLARLLGVHHLEVTGPAGRKILQPDYLAGLALKAVNRWCHTADPAPAGVHVPYVPGIDAHHVDPDGGVVRGMENNRVVREHLEPTLAAAWADLSSPAGQLPYRHDHYLKLWQVGSPRIAATVILFDEAQDAAPVMLDAVRRQDHAQVVYVGDSQQQIYEWRGAVDALDHVAADATAYLSTSFRFGPPIAGLANLVLAELGADLRLDGAGGPSVLAELRRPDAVLTRTNAAAVRELLQAQLRGRRAHLIGGGEEVARFAEGARELKELGWTGYHDLACFESWGEVLCLAPGTRILTPDLRWVPARELVLGDPVLGFDEHAGAGRSGRFYKAAAVTSTARLVLPCWRLRFDNGAEVIASTDHRWLTKTTLNNVRWQETRRLRIGSEVVSLGLPWEREESHDAGWLAGMWDGEGCVSGRTKGTGNVSLAQRTGPVLDRAESAMKERGFDVGRHVNARGIGHLTLRGGLPEKLRLLGTLRPERLVAKADVLWSGSRVEARTRARIVAIEDVGEVEVVALATSTATFVAEGLLSHNSYVAQDPQGDELRLMAELVEEFGVDVILDAIEKMPPEEAAELVVSTAHKAKGREWPTVRLGSDFPDPDEDDLDAGEWRLIYVALTRAREALDPFGCPPLLALLERDRDADERALDEAREAAAW